MSDVTEVMHVVDSHCVSERLSSAPNRNGSGGLMNNGQYAWFADGPNMIVYSKYHGCVLSNRSFAVNQKDKSLKITCVKELKTNKKTYDILLVGCSFKSSGILFVCQLPSLTTIRCIELPDPISCISMIMNEPFSEDILGDKLKIMSTVLIVGMVTGAVYAVDLKQNHINNQLKRNEIVVDELKPCKLFSARNEQSKFDSVDSHLAMVINENVYAHLEKQYDDKQKLSITSLLYIKEINSIAIGYSTGHFKLWDCKLMHTIYETKESKCVMPITHIEFLQPSDDSKNVCYIWTVQSDNIRLPNATMIALTYKEKAVMPDGSLIYSDFQEYSSKLEILLSTEIGNGHCISVCNTNFFRKKSEIYDDREIRLFVMLIEVRQHINADPKAYLFLFDIDQWYKAYMPSILNNLDVSNSYASFVKLPYINNYLDFNITDQSLRPFHFNFRSNTEELYYPSSIYFECDCLTDTEIIRFKHTGIQQEILDQLLLESWRLLINPISIFNKCIQANLNPFFWVKPNDYMNYSLSDKRSFVISILVENKMMSVLYACIQKWKNENYVTNENAILHLVQCLWNHVLIVKQYLDKLVVSLYSRTQLEEKIKKSLIHCLSQMQCVKYFLEDLYEKYNIYAMNVDSYHCAHTLNLVIEYFNATICFLNYGLLPESLENYSTQHSVSCALKSLIQYANKRRIECGHLKLYLIDAVINNEPEGNKLVEQWLHEGGDLTDGMYPPSNIQGLLRIYLNVALSDKVKNYIIIYFLIDICSIHRIHTKVANRMTNFAFEFDIANKELNTLCRASWLLDHDMFEDAMILLSSKKEWLMNNDISQGWFHWTVLKLCVFKSEYYWAGFYLNLINMEMVTIDDHKFYINIQIMNDQCYDALSYIRIRPVEEREILINFLINQCKQTKKLKNLINYNWDSNEEKLLFSYLKSFNDAETLTMHLLYLLQRGRYLEASKLNKSSESICQSNSDNKLLTITSLLAKKFEQNIPQILKHSFKHSFPSIFKNTKVITKLVNCDNKMFIINNKKNNFGGMESSDTLSNSFDFISTNNNILKRSLANDLVNSEKRRKICDNTEKIGSKKPNNKIVSPIDGNALQILNTPLIEKIVRSPSIMDSSSISKIGQTKKNGNKISSIRNEVTPLSKSMSGFRLPDNFYSKIKQFVIEKSTGIPKTENQRHECIYNIHSNANCNTVNQLFIQPTQINLKGSLDDINKMKMYTAPINNKEENNKHEKMKIFEEYTRPKKIQIDGNIMAPNLFTNIAILSTPDYKEKEKDNCYADEHLISEDKRIKIKHFHSIDTEENCTQHIQPNIGYNLSINNEFQSFESNRKGKILSSDSNKIYEFSCPRNEDLGNIDGNNKYNEGEKVLPVPEEESSEMSFGSVYDNCILEYMTNSSQEYENLYNYNNDMICLDSKNNDKIENLPSTSVFRIKPEITNNVLAVITPERSDGRNENSSRFKSLERNNKISSSNSDRNSVHSDQISSEEKNVDSNYTSSCNFKLPYDSSIFSVVSLVNSHLEDKWDSSKNKSNKSSPSDKTSIHNYIDDFYNNTNENTIVSNPLYSISQDELDNVSSTDPFEIDSEVDSGGLAILLNKCTLKRTKESDFENSNKLTKKDYNESNLLYNISSDESIKMYLKHQSDKINKESKAQHLNEYHIEESNKDIEKVNTLERKDNDVEAIYSNNLISTSALKNPTPGTFDFLAEESCFLKNDNELNIRKNNLSTIIDFNIRHQENLNSIVKHNINNLETIQFKCENNENNINETCIIQNNAMYVDLQDNSNIHFETLNQIPSDEFCHLITSEIESSPPKTLEIDDNQFKPDFDQQNISNQPISDKLKIQDLIEYIHEEVTSNKESADNLSRVLELKSLFNICPDSNLQLESKEINKAYNNQSPVALHNSQLSNAISENKIPKINKKLSLKSQELNDQSNMNNIHQTGIVTIMANKSKEMSFNFIGDEKNKMSLLNSGSTKNMKTFSKSKRNIRATSEQKQFTWSIMTRSKRAKSVINYSDNEHSNQSINLESLQQKYIKTVFDSKSNLISHTKNLESNSNENNDTNLNNEKLKCIKPVESKDMVFQQVDNSILDFAEVEKISKTLEKCIFKSKKMEETLSKNISNEKTEIQENAKCKISVRKSKNVEKLPVYEENPILIKKSDELKKNINVSRRMSTKKPSIFQRHRHCTVKDFKPNALKSYTIKTISNYSCQSKTRSKMKDSLLLDTNVIVTRSRSRSNAQTAINSTGVENDVCMNNAPVKVSKSKKRLKSHQDVLPSKHKNRRSKPVEGSITTFGLMKMSEKEILNAGRKTECPFTTDENIYEKDDSILDLKRNLMLPNEPRKRSLSLPVKNGKKQKTIMKVKGVNYMFLIDADNFKQQEFIPKKKQTKAHTADVNSKCNDLLSNKTIGSSVVIKNNCNVNLETFNEDIITVVKETQKTKAIKKQRKLSSYKKFSLKKPTKVTNMSDVGINIKEMIHHQVPVKQSTTTHFTSDKRITRLQQSLIEKSLQLTLYIGHNQLDNNVPEPKIENKKKIKSSNIIK